MKVLVINGSPAGQNSITLQTIWYIKKFFPGLTFEVLDAGQKIRQMEKDFSVCSKALSEADLLLFCYPVYTFLAPAQLHRFIELMKEQGPSLTGKYATQLTTSKHFYDTTAHQYIEDNCQDLGLNYIPGLSADMEDLLKEQGQEEALAFFRYVLWNMDPDQPWQTKEASSTANTAAGNGFKADLTANVENNHMANPATDTGSTNNIRIALVTDTDLSADNTLNQMIKLFQQDLTGEVSLVNLADFQFTGGCLGCFHCASDGTCIYKDGFDRLLREQIQTADAIVYAYTIKDHSMGYRFKLYDDRQFCNGHRTVTMGKPVGYLVSGDLDREYNLQTLMQARAQVGGNFLAGVVTDRQDPKAGIRKLTRTLIYAIENHYQPPKNFYGVGGLKIFRDLIWQMQGLMREDHRFYKKHGFYDFPQKHKGRVAAMYLVGGMMSNKRLQKKIGGRMTEGMLMPYKKVLKKTNATKD